MMALTTEKRILVIGSSVLMVLELVLILAVVDLHSPSKVEVLLVEP